MYVEWFTFGEQTLLSVFRWALNSQFYLLFNGKCSSCRSFIHILLHLY